MWHTTAGGPRGTRLQAAPLFFVALTNALGKASRQDYFPENKPGVQSLSERGLLELRDGSVAAGSALCAQPLENKRLRGCGLEPTNGKR